MGNEINACDHVQSAFILTSQSPMSRSIQDENVRGAAIGRDSGGRFLTPDYGQKKTGSKARSFITRYCESHVASNQPRNLRRRNVECANNIVEKIDLKTADSRVAAEDISKRMDDLRTMIIG